MKHWTKIFELEEYDVVVQRLSNDENQEHVTISLRFEKGMFVQLALFDDIPEDADLFYKKYTTKQAKMFVKTFETQYLETNDDPEEIDKTKD